MTCYNLWQSLTTGSEIFQTLCRPNKTHPQDGFHPLVGNLICVSMGQSGSATSKAGSLGEGGQPDDIS